MADSSVKCVLKSEACLSEATESGYVLLQAAFSAGV